MGSKELMEIWMRRFVFTGIMLLAACNSGQKLFFSDGVSPEAGAFKMHEPEQVTAGNESNFAPDISLDGKIVVYTSDRKGNKDIWRKASGGGFGYPLTLHSADDFSPVLSPDGDAVAFVSRREDAAGDISIIDLGFTFGLPGNNKERTVQTVSSNTTEDSSPAWFPNGKKVIFAARRPGDSLSSLMVAEISDLKAQQLSDLRGEQPSVSPDGNIVAYVKAGAIYLYHLDTEKNEQLTDSGLVQDGHPRFSSDGKTLVFVRYADDTNGDGVLNADDRATAWKLDIAKHRAQKIKNNFAIEPLTAGSYSTLYPQIRSPYLYVALNTEDGLDISRFPEYGQVQLTYDKEKFEALLTRVTNPDEKIFLLRKMQHVADEAGEHSALIDYSLRELEAHLQRGHALELSWLSGKLKENFPEEANVAVIAETLGIESELAPLLFPTFSGNLTPARLKILQGLAQRAGQLSQRLDPRKDLHGRAQAEILLLQAKIQASMRQFFEAQKALETIDKEYPTEKRTLAKAQLYSGMITPAVSGVDAAVVIYKDVISSFRDQSDIVQQAVDHAVNLVASAENPIEALQRMKSESEALPVLASSAHLRIAEIFKSRNLESVYANELRQIVEQYPDAEMVVLKAADVLSKIEEKNDRYDDAEKMLVSLRAASSGKSVEYAKSAKRLYLDFVLRLAEGYQKSKNFTAAGELYRRVIKEEPLDINGHKGLIDSHFKGGTLNKIEEYYEDQYREHDHSPEWIYFWSYVLTYRIDSAQGVRAKIVAIDDAIAIAEESRAINAQILQVHQTLGWLYLQKGYWLGKYYNSGSVFADVRQRFNITRNFFGAPEPNWLELAIESFQAAYFLSKPDSIERAGIARNLAQTYYELKNYQRALSYYSQRIKLLPIIPIRDPEVEALVFRNAGRSAFQVEELELAESLQRSALLAWEKLNDKDMIKYAIDALALTLQERKNFAEARQLYDRLRRLHVLDKDPFNEVAALTNMGYCSFQMDQLDDALARFDEASQILDSSEGTGDDVKKEASSAIQIDLGGQGSAAKGFSLFNRRNLLVTFKAKIFEKRQRWDMVYDQIQRKLDLLKSEREFGMDNSGRDKKYLAEEISIVANNLGDLASRSGRWQKASEHFQEAEAFALLLRADGQEVMSAQESINYINYVKIELRKAGLGLLSPEDSKALANQIDARTAILQKKFAEGDKSEARYIAQLASVSHQLRLTSAPVQRITLPDESVQNLFAAHEAQASNPRSSRTMLFAFRDISADSETDAVTLARSAYDKFREDGMKSPEFEWKFLAIENQYDKAFEAADRFIAGGGVLASAADRLLLRKIFEKVLSNVVKGEQDSAAFLLRRYLLTRYLELANRDFAIEKVVDGHSQRELSPRIRTLLELKSPDDLKTSLLEAGSVTLHRMIDGRVLVAWISQKSSFFRIINLKSSSKLTAENYKKVLADSGVLQAIKTDGVRQLYITPSSELFAVAWDNILRSENVEIAYLPAVDFMPTLLKRRNVNKHWISHVSSHLNPLNLSASLGSRDYDRFDEARVADPVSLRKAEVLHIDAPVMLNPVEAVPSYLDFNSNFTGDATDVSLRSFADVNQSNSSGAIFSMVVPANTDLKNSIEGHDGWVSLFIASLSSGMPTIVVVPAIEGEKKGEGGKVIGTEWKARSANWSLFYKELAAKSFSASVRTAGLPGRVIGYAGVSEDISKEIAEEQFEETLEEAEASFDDQAFAEAAILFRKSYVYSLILGKTDAEEELLRNIYTSQHKNQRYTDAVYYIEKLIAKRSAAKDRDDDQIASDHVDAGISSMHGRLFDKAEGHFKAAETYFLQEEEWGFLAKIYENRAYNLVNQVKYEDAIAAHLKSHEYFLKSNPENAALRLLAVANIYSRNLSQYDRALDYFDQSIAKLKSLGKPTYLSVIVDKANTLLTIGEIDAAISAIEKEVLPNIDEEEQISLWIRANQSLANIYFRGGKFPQARAITEQIIEECQRIEDLRVRTERMNDAISLRAMVLAKTGNYAEAFEEFRKAIRSSTRYGLKAQVALLYNNYGFWAREYGATEQSIRFFEIAQRIDEELASRSSIAYDQRNIGLSAIVKGDFSRAEDLLNEALKTSEELNLAYNLAYSQFGLGDMEKAKSNFSKARDYYEKALTISHKSRLSDLVWRADAAIGMMAGATGDISIAEKHLRNAVATIESLSPGLKTEYSRNAFLSDAGIYEVYDQLIDLLMKNGQASEAWSLSERVRSRSLIDTISSQNITFASADLNRMMERERTLKTSGDQGKREYAALLQDIAAKNPRIMPLISAKAPALSDVTARMSSVETLIQYHVTAGRIHWWVIRQGKQKSGSLELDTEQLRTLVREYREIMHNYSSTVFLENKLSDLLIKPLTSHIEGSQRILVVPHQSLHFVPFAALKMNGRYLVENFSVSYLDSAAQLLTASESKGAIKNVVAFGYDQENRIPFTIKEVESIRRFFPATKTFTGKDASKSQLRTSVTGADALHIATHGSFNTADPTRSYLAFAGGEGQLTVQEIFAIGNNLDLVTLSACESGIGEISAGEEIVGLHKAFAVAGAKSVVSNLWRINDVTSAVVMKRFYRALAEGKSKTEAMRLAQLVAKQHFEHPAYWASYRLVGGYL